VANHTESALTTIGRIPVLDITPLVSGGIRPTKAVVHERITIGATVFREGHDSVAADVLLTSPDGELNSRQPLVLIGHGTDRYEALVSPAAEGLWHFSIEAWSDPISTWLHRLHVKIPAGIDVELEFAEGALLLERVIAQAKATDVAALSGAQVALTNTKLTPGQRLAIVDEQGLKDALAANPLRELVSTYGPFPMKVERQRALYGSWYEFFPRSEGAVQKADGTFTSGNFKTASQRLSAVADMGFDVVYLPPIHPVGKAFRKGPNNTLTPGPHDPGSPWAVGAAEGGHDAIHPDLGTLKDFDAFVAAAKTLGMEIALDLALQASPDHPWVGAHPEWFTTRADGTIAYAENPPKKYQDIYPINFDNDPEGIYQEVLRVVQHWMKHGVRIFRVDNPHTKPVAFWERLIGEVNSTDPDVIFLAEAFTRPAMMRALGEVGFQQSYTYFTWRNEKYDLEEYLRELSGPAAAYMRPNFFANTPDILPEYLQLGGPAAFAIRAALASTLSPTWGIYAGYELYENAPVKEGSEEYLDSEKYEYKPRDWEAAAESGKTLAPFITQLNAIRRAHPALQQLRNITFHRADDDAVICYSKQSGDDIILCIVTLDPSRPIRTTIHLNMPALGANWHDKVTLVDELSGKTWSWHEHNEIAINPHLACAMIMQVKRG
jgi:starch synthase (maltosyl-transferring)